MTECNDMESFRENFYKSIFGLGFVFHFIAIFLTYIFVVSGFDWAYLVLAQSSMPMWVLYAVDILGFILPIIILLILIIYAYVKKSYIYKIVAIALTQSIAISFFISVIYKMFTGRVSPPHHGIFSNISNEFNFGFMNGGILGGWPSSHASVLFAIAFCLIVLFPRNWKMKIIVLFVALTIGIGETIGFHWFSEFVSGALIGGSVGIVVGTHFNNLLNKK